jgi:hypothetical protein
LFNSGILNFGIGSVVKLEGTKKLMKNFDRHVSWKAQYGGVKIFLIFLGVANFSLYGMNLGRLHTFAVTRARGGRGGS